MNELIKVSTTNERQTVLGRDLYEFLEVNSNYTTWFNRMCEYGFEEEKDFISYLPNLESSQFGGQNKINHQLTLDMAKEISMIQRSDKGKQARQYFIECERKLTQLSLPQNYVEALKALVCSEEVKLRLEEDNKAKQQVIEAKQQQIEIMQTKVILADTLTNNDQCYDMAVFSNVIGNKKLGRNNMFKYLRDKGILKENNSPYQPYAHYFKVITKPNYYNNDINVITLVRSNGVAYLVKKLIEDQHMKPRPINEILKQLENTNN